MRCRPCPALHADVTELALGTWGLAGEAYGPVARREAEAVIERALELGVSLFDTSDCYAKGEMERILGQRLQGQGSNARVITRLGTDRSGDPPRKCFEPSYLRDAFRRSQERLKRDRIDVCMLHNPTVMTIERGEASEVLQELVQTGEIGAWGISIDGDAACLAAVEAGAPILSLPYNVFHSRQLHAIAGEIAMRGVSILAHSVLAYGLLAAHWAPDRDFDEGDHRRERWSKEALRQRVELLHVVRAMVSGPVMTPRAAALRFVLSNSLVSSAILGPRTVGQLEQLVREAGDGPPYLPEGALGTLSSRLLSVGILS